VAKQSKINGAGINPSLFIGILSRAVHGIVEAKFDDIVKAN
jgi:hypothetical protein